MKYTSNPKRKVVKQESSSPAKSGQNPKRYAKSKAVTTKGKTKRKSFSHRFEDTPDKKAYVGTAKWAKETTKKSGKSKSKTALSKKTGTASQTTLTASKRKRSGSTKSVTKEYKTTVLGSGKSISTKTKTVKKNGIVTKRKTK